MGLCQTKKLCTAKETLKETKRLSTEWEKIFANNMFNKGLISKIQEEFIQLNINKKQNKTNKQKEQQQNTNPIKNGQRI